MTTEPADAADPTHGPAAALTGLDLDRMSHNADRAARLLKTLANPNRLMLLCALAEGERSVGELNARVPLSQSALSQHLGVLRTRGLVETRRQAQTIYYHLAPTEAIHLIRALHEVYCGPRHAGAV